MDCVYDVSSCLDADSLALIHVYLSDSVLATSPPSIHQPHIGPMLFNLLRQQIRINLRLEWHKSLAKTCRESGNRLLNSLLSTCNLSSVA